MFTGIIEQIAEVVKVENEGSNIHITLTSTITNELKIDQSVAHNGVCLTVVAINEDEYTVTAIKETLEKSNIGLLAVGSKVNMERCLKVGARLDGHMVQGHVDQTAKCVEVKEEKGSYVYTFKHKQTQGMTVEKGSVCVNGVSLTVINLKDTSFSVAIIPFTHEHTNFHEIEQGTVVNIEYDILGKYISKMFLNNI
ncbi:MAG: riboflavin synthase [Flavobacteriales bacterium]|jgi:riboflavin synthase|nr:riboflavin synthase [Flavobacteriales bacterium]MBT5750773.1 riboflavin synthase [Flavobacteriales bacterium]